MSRKRPNKKQDSRNVDSKSKVTKDSRNVDSKSKVTKSADDRSSDVTPTKEEAIADTKEAGSKNDPDWYAADPQIAIDAASLPFSLPFGAPINTRVNGLSINTEYGPGMSTTVLADPVRAVSAPGVCTLKLHPSIGHSDSRTSPVNVCANAFYTHVRYVNSGRKNYDPCDLMMYGLTMADIYSFIFYCIRLYNYAFMYSNRNWFVGKELITAAGADADNLLSNLANFRYWLNTYINKVSALLIPSDINIFKRKVFLYSGLYIENGDGNIKDQLYQFAPASFYKFDLDSDKKGRLTRKLWTWNSNVSVIRAFGEDLLANITGDEDFGLMSGDILKAYGERVVSIAPIPEEGGILPTYDPYILSQFKNAHVVSNMVTQPTSLYAIFSENPTRCAEVWQDTDGNIINHEVAPGDIRCLPTIAPVKMLCSSAPQPGPAEVLELTRLTVSLDGSLGPQYANKASPVAEECTHYEFNCGTEIVGQAMYSTVHESASGDPSPNSFDRFTVIGNAVWQEIRAEGDDPTGIPEITAEHLSVVTGFKYNPVYWMLGYDSTAGKVNQYAPISNIENVCLVETEQLDRIHEAALFGLFFVPGVARLVNNV